MILRATALGLFVFTPSLEAAQVKAVPARSVQKIQALGYTYEGVVDGVVFDDQDPSAAEGAAPVPSGPAKKLSPRAEKLKKLEYDRRPSSILKAWANPPKPKEEAKPVEAAKPGDAPASPASPAGETKPSEPPKEEKK